MKDDGEIILVKNKYYILAKSSFADDRTRVLKDGDTFGVFDRFGDIQPVGFGEQGVFHEGTRFLSRLSTLLEGRDRPHLLSSSVKSDNVLLVVDLANFDLERGGKVAVPRGTVHIFRTRFLRDGAVHDTIRVRNYGMARIRMRIVVEFEADFRDIFEVRGVARKKRGVLHPARVRGSGVEIAYDGLDRVRRRLVVACSPKPRAYSANSVVLEARLAPGAESRWEITFLCESGKRRTRSRGACKAALAEARERDTQFARVVTTSRSLNRWFARSVADLAMMTTETPFGPYPYAGVPWFSVPFGRDGIITALECLWVNPALARGVLSFLAATQANRSEPIRDSAPGKILHEMRRGEMAALGEIPFGRYYGSVDATPLFVLLAGAYWQRTADLAFVKSLWPAVERALGWIDRYGEGFCTFSRESAEGLANQGWRDSGDANFHADGSLAKAPLALCEVQGYVYAARRAAALLADALGSHAEARSQLRRAERLRARFEKAFWLPDLGTYAAALDHAGRPCRVRTSCAGHALFTGIAAPDRAASVARALFDDKSWSGWGIRTLATTEARYNPMSYHNGSVWPHDNAIIAAGLSRYGFRHEPLRILDAHADSTAYFEQMRLPELFCGFRRREGEAPTRYPVACSPQSWSAGASFLMLQACLGLSVRAPEKRIRFARPMLPTGVEWLRLEGLEVAGATLDLELRQQGKGVSVAVESRGGPEIEVVKVT